jgi:DNA (cytosine-5)-methyltransferase 1
MTLRVFSTFSGISAASVAWKPFGFDFVGYCEPEPLPCHVLNARCDATAPVYLPEGYRAANYKHIKGGSVPNWGDVTQITDKDLLSMGQVDVLEGGSPCQDFSIAGLRKGLNGDRGNLTLAFVQLALRMKKLNGLRFVVWENVYHVLTDRTNAFGKFLAALVGGPECGLVSSGDGWRGGWTGAGHVTGPAGQAAWRVLDAQGWGVPQRRRRVFAVCRFGDEPVCPGQVLFEPDRQGWGATAGGEPKQEAAGASGRSAQGVAPIAFCDDYHPKASFNLAYTLLAGSPTGGGHKQCVAYYDRQKSDQYGEAGIASTLRACGSAAYETDLVVYPAVTGTLCASGAGLARAAGQGNETDLCVVLRSAANSNRKWIVRRLTPLECERLQGFPDGWSDVPYKGKESPEDGPRYKALGNSMAVPCMAYIGRELQQRVSQAQWDWEESWREAA